MKDLQKRWQLNSTDSVIAKLMGFDELRLPQRPLCEKSRVLSESYLRNAASVGVRPGSLVATGRLHMTKNEIIHEMKDVSGLRISKGKNDNIFGNSVNSSDSKMKKGIPDRKHVLRYLQKHDQDPRAGHYGELGIHYVKKSLEFQFDMEDKPDINAIKLKSDLEDAKFDPHSRSRYREHGKSFKPESGKDLRQLAYKEPVVNGTTSCRHTCAACTRTMSRFFRQERHRSKFDELIRTGYMGDKKVADEVEGMVLSNPGIDDLKNHSHDPQDLLNQSSLANESTKQKVERWKAAKAVQEVGVCVRGQNLDKMHDFDDKKSLPGKGLCRLSSLQSRNSSCSPSDNDVEKDRCKEFELSQRNFMSLIRNFVAQRINDATYASAEASSIDVCTRTNGDSRLELIPVTLSGESDHSSYVQEVSVEEAFSNEYSEEESAFSNSSRTGFQDNLKGTYQQSPNSVLEPFDVQNPSSSQHFDSIGLQLQLEALNFDSEETYSEGSVLVSGDEDFEEGLGDLSHDGRIIKTWLGDDKSSNYSYMVDVLDEAEFFGMKSFMDFKTWYSLECPISPLVFDALEEKYGKQKYWVKSERQLLFDRINSGLISIFNPIISFHACATSIRSRFCTSLRRDEVEDELWMMLKEMSQDLSEKAFDKWFQIEEGINIICGELETILFDELMMEMGFLWD